MCHRRRVGRAVVATAMLVVSAALFAPPAFADGTPPPQAFVVVDAGTGAVLTSRNLHEALPPASTAKIMTALVAVERLPPNSTIAVGADAAARESMRIGMTPGQRWPFEQAMASMMMVSANDSAYAVAETVGGSLDNFAAELNATAKRFGMKDSTWGDPAGLTDSTSYKGGPEVSAYDLAIATRNALTVPAISKWSNTRIFDFTDVAGTHHELKNHNKFLPDNGFGYAGANGFKTGYTAIAQHTLVATAYRNGRELIAVILGSSDSGYTWAQTLLDQGFATPAGTKGTGVHLPPVAVSPYGTRLAEQAGFVQAARGTHAASLTATPTSTPSTVHTPAGVTTTKRASTHHGSAFTTTNFFIVVFLLLLVAFFLRRRAVTRQRARRRVRQRARAKAMRSGSLPVVDGRYRTGTRVGKPLESHVHVERTYIDLTKEESRQPPRRRRSSSEPG